MKQLVIFSILSILVSLTTTASVAADTEVKSVIEQEIKKDLSNGESCFRGKILHKHIEMQEFYGGRYSGEYEFDFVPVFETQYRAPAKYCDTYLDQDQKPTEDYEKALYRLCITENFVNYVVPVRFEASTTGTFETEGLVFSVKEIKKTTLIVKKDASYFPEEDEIFSEKHERSLVCKKIDFPNED
ncbi:MAG: hypothetical protein M9962_03010 [Oligoflexia bacterium]|nr:hypothetical protein [Oligoflexia bacterium]